MAKSTPEKEKTDSQLESTPSFGPALNVFNSITRFFWDCVLVQTGPWFQGPGGATETPFLVRRDIFNLVAFGASIVFFFALHLVQYAPLEYWRWINAFLVALSSYQIFGLAVGVGQFAVLGVTRGLQATPTYPDYRIRRTLLLALMNYIELIFWFAVLYCSLSRLRSATFCPACEKPAGALLLSMSTMLSIGYSPPPPNLILTLVCTAQGFLGIIILISLIGTLANLSKGTSDFLWSPKKTIMRYIVPLLLLIGWFGLGIFLLVITATR